MRPEKLDSDELLALARLDTERADTHGALLKMKQVLAHESPPIEAFAPRGGAYMHSSAYGSVLKTYCSATWRSGRVRWRKAGRRRPSRSSRNYGATVPITRSSVQPCHAMMLLGRFAEAKELLLTTLDSPDVPKAPIFLARVLHHLW